MCLHRSLRAPRLAYALLFSLCSIAAPAALRAQPATASSPVDAAAAASPPAPSPAPQVPAPPAAVQPNQAVSPAPPAPAQQDQLAAPAPPAPVQPDQAVSPSPPAPAQPPPAAAPPDQAVSPSPPAPAQPPPAAAPPKAIKRNNDRPLFETTVTARGPTTAASASTIRNLDFELRPHTSPNDVLRVVPGLLAVQHQGGGKADQLFLRGFDADHGTDVGVYIDGIPVNMGSHAHGQGFADLHWLIPEALERIDVVKGPYDVRFGDFSTAGAINLITRERFDSSSVQYTLGMFPTIDGRLAAQGRFVGIIAPALKGWAAKLHPWLAFEAAYDDGPFTTPQDLKRYNLFGKVSYDLTSNLKIGVFFQGYGSGWLSSGQIPARDIDRIGPFGSEDPSEGGLTERQMFTAFLKYKKPDQELDITAYVTRYRLSLFSDFTFFLNNPTYADGIEQDDARVFTGAKLAYRFTRRWRSISLRTAVGGDLRFDGIHVDRWDVESQNGDYRKRLGRHIDQSDLALSGNNNNIDILNLAAYAEEDVVFNRYFRLIGGLRADFFGFNVDDQSELLGPGQPATSGVRQFTTFSPKATAVISPVPMVLDLYLNFGQGFHTNQAQVALLDGSVHVNADGSSFTNHAIPKLYGGEVGARVHLWNRIDAAAAFWMSYLENETVFDGDNASFAPSDPTRRLGLDFEVRARIASWLVADFDLAQAESTVLPDLGKSGALALAPKLYMTGGLTVKHPVGVRAGLRFRFLDQRPAYDETSAEYQHFTARTLPDGRPNPDYDPSRVTAPGYFILDAYAAYRFRFLELAISAQNLLNATWREAQFGNRSCTYDEVYNPQNPNYAGSGSVLADGSYANRCGIGYAGDPRLGSANTRSGVVDLHYTPGVPLNLQFTLKAYF